MNYNIDNNNIFNIILELKNKIKENQNIISELLKIDYKYCKIKTTIEILEKVLNSFENEKIDIKQQQTILINYNGDPKITLNLGMLAILTKNTIILENNKNMLGVNRFIVEIINNTLKKYQTDKLIYLSENYTEENIDKIICIDDINRYNKYLIDKNEKVKFYSFNYLDLYRDSEEFEEIEELIYQYAETAQTNVESYSELDVNTAIQMISTGLGTEVVLLTLNEKTKEIFEKNIKNKKIYINKNPFENKKIKIEKEMLYI